MPKEKDLNQEVEVHEEVAKNPCCEEDGERCDTIDSSTKLSEELATVQAKVDKNWELYLSAKAEMENIKKRSDRDVANAHKYALEKFVAELLGIKDSLEMGVKAASEFKNEEIEKFVEGSHITIKMFDELFVRFNIKEVNPENEAFNPDLHQAMTMQESESHESNMVIDVIQKGYQLNDRLLRPALVIVSK